LGQGRGANDELRQPFFHGVFDREPDAVRRVGMMGEYPKRRRAR